LFLAFWKIEKRLQDMNIFEHIIALEKESKEAVLCTVVRAKGSTPRGVGSKMLVYPDGSITDTIGGGEMEKRVIIEALASLLDGQPRLLEYNFTDPQKGDPGICGGQMEVFVEPIKPLPTLLVIGAGHVGKATAQLAHWLGWRVAVVDDRQEFVTPENIPEADIHLHCALDEIPEHHAVHSQTHVVMTTRNVEIDASALPALLETPAAYIGIIGSRRRWATTRKLLMEKGIKEQLLSRITSPIGLDLNAETPEEIALSIMAEILMLKNSGTGNQMAS
jgi:xanthine dehydrogenase accessory factor